MSVRPLTLPSALCLKAVPLPQRGERDERVARGGFTLLEVIVAAGVVGVLFLVSIPLLAHVRQVRQEADRRMIAQQEAANVMETIAPRAIQDELSRSDLETLALSPAAERLPDAALDVALDEAADPLPGHRVTVRVTWTTETGTTAPPAELSAWFPTKGGE